MNKYVIFSVLMLFYSISTFPMDRAFEFTRQLGLASKGRFCNKRFQISSMSKTGFEGEPIDTTLVGGKDQEKQVINQQAIDLVGKKILEMIWKNSIIGSQQDGPLPFSSTPLIKHENKANSVEKTKRTFNSFTQSQRRIIRMAEGRGEFSPEKDIKLPKELIRVIAVDPNVAKVLRATCKSMATLFVPEYLGKMRRLCEDSYDMQPWSKIHCLKSASQDNLLNVFAFAVALNDAKNAAILREKFDVSDEFRKYIIYKRLIELEIFNGRKETVTAVLTKDPFGCNNWYYLRRGPLIDDITHSLCHRYYSNNGQFLELSIDEQNEYIDLLKNCGCKSFSEIRDDERNSSKIENSLGAPDNSGNSICTLF